MQNTDRVAVLIGQSGLLGNALNTTLRDSEVSSPQIVVLPHRTFVNDVLAGRAGQTIAAILARGGQQDWICAVGNVDPAAHPDAIANLNCTFPLRLHDLLASNAKDGDIRLMTFGSALEAKPDLARPHPYLASKLQLFSTLVDRAWPGWRHVRLHTLYGGEKAPHPNMFAGQMFESLQKGVPFRMSHGKQFREYHHVDDVACSVAAILRDQPASTLIELNSGAPIRLRDLAVSIFEKFGSNGQLEIGVLPAAEGEVLEASSGSSPFLKAHRNSVEGMIAWFDALGLKRHACLD